MFARLSALLVFLASLLAAQGFDAVPAVTFGPQTISSSSGQTVTITFGLTTLVHGPYTLDVQYIQPPGATFKVNGTQVLGPGISGGTATSQPFALNASNTLEVAFEGKAPNASLTVSIVGWEYMFASEYSTLSSSGSATITPDSYPSGSLDWSTKGVVTPVMNQGLSCPASWAFATAGSVEGFYAITKGDTTPLSEQQMIDCSGAPSCWLGNTAMATEYVVGAGLLSEASYPYAGRQGTCSAGGGPYTITGVKRVTAGSENALGATVDSEPVSIVINGNWFSGYTGGVANPDCEAQIPIFVSALLVGYGIDTTTGTPYWKVKNSLGTSWGEAGYFRIVRNQNKCGIADYGLYVQ